MKVNWKLAGIMLGGRGVSCARVPLLENPKLPCMTLGYPTAAGGAGMKKCERYIRRPLRKAFLFDYFLERP